MFLLLSVACTPLAGTWEGDADCSGFNLPVHVELEPEGDHYVGWGSIDCSVLYGEECMQSFDIDLEQEDGPGDDDLSVDLDDCELHTLDGVEAVSCDDPTDMEWDGADAIEGDWAGCDVELERD